MIEVFEGEKSKCYSGFIDTKKQIYFNRMIQDFNRHEGRVTDTIIKAEMLKRTSVESIALIQGENEIQLVEKTILFKSVTIYQMQKFDLDSARLFIVSK